MKTNKNKESDDYVVKDFGEAQEPPFVIVDENGNTYGGVYEDYSTALDKSAALSHKTIHPIFPIVAEVEKFEEVTGEEVNV